MRGIFFFLPEGKFLLSMHWPRQCFFPTDTIQKTRNQYHSSINAIVSSVTDITWELSSLKKTWHPIFLFFFGYKPVEQFLSQLFMHFSSSFTDEMSSSAIHNHKFCNVFVHQTDMQFLTRYIFLLVSKTNSTCWSAIDYLVKKQNTTKPLETFRTQLHQIPHWWLFSEKQEKICKSSNINICQNSTPMLTLKTEWLISIWTDTIQWNLW